MSVSFVQQRSFKSQAWAAGPSNPDFPNDCVDVWRVNLDEVSSTVTARSILSSDELNRANRFHFEKDRMHFVRCRSVLRILLGRYLAIPAEEVCFEYHPSGKPEVADQQNPRRLRFNVSHSNGLALIAVSAGRRLGVDIEMIRAEVDTLTLAEQFFSLGERASLRSLPNQLRVPAFFACWTRKESFLKATGEGLSFPLADFSVTPYPDLNPRVEEIRGDTEAGKRWLLVDLSVVDCYRATLAVEGTFYNLETYTQTSYLLP